jgi:hypothetical protein
MRSVVEMSFSCNQTPAGNSGRTGRGISPAAPACQCPVAHQMPARGLRAAKTKMPKRRRTIPIAFGQDPDPNFEINEETWRQIEAALGEGISLPIRSELLEATRRFLFWAPYEKAAASTLKAKARISEIAKVADQLLEDHTKRHDIEARLYADMLINIHLIKLKNNERRTGVGSLSK